MSDGAHLGIGAEAAMKAVIGGEQPTERVTTRQLIERIMATTRETATTYASAADYIAKLILVAFRADPSLTKVPTENEYSIRDDGTTDYGKVRMPGLWGVLAERLTKADVEFVGGCTGFMWGWAVSAARACMELPPVPNPAILTFGGG